MFSGKFEAKVGVGFSAYMERNSYVEFENATIYTNTVKLEGAFILGAAVEITGPSIKLDFPW